MGNNIYRPRRTLREQTKQFINEFTSLVQDLDSTNFNIVLAGDYNLNLLKINENEICCECFDLLTYHSLFPHITLPTRLTNGGGTLIDNLFCKLNKSIKKNTAGILLKGHCIEFKYYADGIHSGLTPPGDNS